MQKVLGGIRGANINSISDLFTSEYMVDDEESLSIDYGELDEEYNSYTRIMSIDIENFNEEMTSIKDCINNNWWYIFEEYNIQRALGIYADDEAYDKGFEETALLDKIVDTLGGPKHIYKGLESSYGLTYTLFYEYPDFGLEIYVHEIVNDGKWLGITVGYVKYAPIEYWNECFENKNLEIIK